MNKRPMYFKTNMIFHNSYLDQLETVIEKSNILSQLQKDNLIKPLYKFGAFSIKWRNKEYPERIVKGEKR